MVETAPSFDSRFRWRGGDVSRIEAFSDAAFAFAVALLVVSMDVPRSFDQLVETLYAFPAFAITFVFLVGIWFHHYHFFRRYGLEDGPTIALNAALLLVVLFFVYPLKFLFLFLTEAALGRGRTVEVASADMPAMMTIYGVGFAAVFALFIALYLHAWRRRDALGLDLGERYDTRSSLQHFAIYIAVAAVSIGLAWLPTVWAGFLSGISYATIGPATAIHGIRREKGRPGA